MNKKPTLILDVWGGLGDNLQVSTIPRRFYEKFGYKGVYISNSVPWRNLEIKELVWDKNPYIAGYTDKRGANIADTGLIQFDGTTNWIQNMEKIYKFNDPYSTRPEIYYDIPFVENNNTVVMDVSYSEESYNRNIQRYPTMISDTKNRLQELLTQLTPDIKLNVIYQPDNLKNINFFESLNLNIPYKKIVVKSLTEYCSIIKNCKQYICSHSGCHALAAAIRKTCICIIPNNYYNMKYFVFDGIKYLTF